jgi:hypothetical protein
MNGRLRKIVRRLPGIGLEEEALLFDGDMQSMDLLAFTFNNSISLIGFLTVQRRV